MDHGTEVVEDASLLVVAELDEVDSLAPETGDDPDSTLDAERTLLLRLGLRALPLALQPEKLALLTEPPNFLCDEDRHVVVHDGEPLRQLASLPVDLGDPLVDDEE